VLFFWATGDKCSCVDSLVWWKNLQMSVFKPKILYTVWWIFTLLSISKYRAAFPAGHILKPIFTIKCGNVWMNHIFINNTCTSLTKQQLDINPHNSLNWDFHLTRRLVYEHTFCQSSMSTKKNCFCLNFHKNITCFSVGLLICQVFSVSYETAYMVKTRCCFMNGMTIKKWFRQLLLLYWGQQKFLKHCFV